MVTGHLPSVSRASTIPDWWPLLLVGAICVGFMGWERHFDLRLHDEGFLWYGAQRVLAGELPLRDFQSYDPGRYFWSAGWMAILNDDGIIALRWGNAILGGITVALATAVVSMATTRPQPGALIAAGLIFTVWMVPDYKVSDSFAAALLMFGLARLMQRPTLARYLGAGICLGLASVIGINHALYGSVATVAIFLLLRGAPQPWPAAAAVIGGGIIGYSPVLGLHAFAPGYSAAFIDSIRLLFEAGTTNLSLPFPDPLALLRVSPEGHLAAAVETLLAILFLAAPLLWLWTLWRLTKGDAGAGRHPAILAPLILSVPYFHYVYSRADDFHAAVSILPVLAPVLASVVNAERRWRWPALAALLAASLIMTARLRPSYHFAVGHPLERVDAGGDRLLIPPWNAVEVRGAQAIATLAGSADFFAGPMLPGAYALARRKAPTWEIYMLFPTTLPRQRAEIARLQAADVRYALISRLKPDGRSDLGLARTHPLVLAHLQRCLPLSMNFPAAQQLTIRRAQGPVCLSREPHHSHVHAQSRPARTGDARAGAR